MRSLRCTLNYKEWLDQEPVRWHSRPAAYVVKLCKGFPETEFTIRRRSGETVNPKILPELMVPEFKDGEEITIEVTGRCEISASEFFKIVWENLGNFSEDPGSKSRLRQLVDETFARIDDPDLTAADKLYAHVTDEPTKAEEESRSVAIINDRLHDVTLPMIPLIARYFGTRVELSFDVPCQGIFAFEMGPTNNYNLPSDILELQIEVGTRITVRTWGLNRLKTNDAIKAVLQSLWQCDEWLRRRAKGFESDSTIRDLLEFAGQVSRFQDSEYGYVQNPFISNLLTTQHVLVRCGEFSKDEALSQLAAPHARIHGLELASILSRVLEAERRQPVVLREGFAIAHGAMPRNPRLAITFGVFPSGVTWKESGEKVRLVAMVLCAEDTYGTWRDYLRKFAIVFRSRPQLQDRLIAAGAAVEFLHELRLAETSLIK